jgi:hypothetical protein
LDDAPLRRPFDQRNGGVRIGTRAADGIQCQIRQKYRGPLHGDISIGS